MPDRLRLSHPASAIFCLGAALSVSSALFYWVFLGRALPTRPLVGLIAGTALVILGIMLSHSDTIRLLRLSAAVVGAATFVIAFLYNSLTGMVWLHPILTSIPSLAHVQTESVTLRFFAGISLAVFGALLVMLAARLRPGSDVAWIVVLTVAIYFLLVGTLAGLVFSSYRHTWGPVWLSFGLWLVTASLRAAPGVLVRASAGDPPPKL